MAQLHDTEHIPVKRFKYFRTVNTKTRL